MKHKLLSLFLWLLPVVMLVSCTNQKPIIVAGKSLLAIQREIVSIRKAITVPCQQKVIPPEQCQKLDSWYQASKPLYDAAVDAEILALRSGKPEDESAALAKKDALFSLSKDLAILAGRYGVKGGESQ